MKFISMLFFIVYSLLSIHAHASKIVKNKTLWSQWYTVTANGKPHAYYLEEVELRPANNQIALSQHWWEKNNFGIQEFYIGAVAKNDKQYSPVAFFVEKKNPNFNIDGRVKKNTLIIKIKTNEKNTQSLNLNLEKGVIFSNYLPLLLAKHFKEKKPGNLFYSAILEDGLAGSYQLESGTAIFAKEKTLSKINNEKCFKAENTFQGISSTWWISEKGKICSVKIPDYQRELKTSTEKEAMHFFDQK